MTPYCSYRVQIASLFQRYQAKAVSEIDDIPTSSTSTKPFPNLSVQPTQINKIDPMDTTDFSASQFSTEDADMSLLNGLVFYLIGFTHSITEVVSFLNQTRSPFEIFKLSNR